MSDTLEIIGQEQYNRMTVGIPEALIKISSQIDQINGKSLSLKGLNESVDAANNLQSQLAATYATITKEQQNAALSIQRLAKANKDNADAALKNAKAQEIQRKTTEANTKADNNAAAAKLKKSAADKKVGDELMRQPVIITNDTNATNANTNAVVANTAAVDAEIKALQEANAWYAAQRQTISTSTSTQAANTTQREIAIAAAAEDAAVTRANTIAHQENNAAIGGGTTTVAQSTKGLRGLWSGLRQIAYILPGIGIAGIFNLAFIAIVKVYEAIFLTKKNVDLLAEAEKKAARDREYDLKNATKFQKEYSEAVQSSIKSNIDAYGKEGAELQILYGSATNVNLSMSDRIKAVKELQDLYPGYFLNMKQEDILAGNATAAYNELNGALIKRISLNVYQDELELLVKQNLEIQKQIDKTNTRKNTNGKFVIDETEGELSYQQLLEKRNGLADLQFENSTKQKGVLQQIFALESDLSKLLVDKPKKERAKREQDTVNSIIEARKRETESERQLRLSELNISIETNKTIFENERETNDKRAAAYAEMFDARQQIAKINLDKQLEDVTTWEAQYNDVVVKALSTEEAKRTEFQNKIIIDARTKKNERIRIEKEYQYELVKIVEETQRYVNGEYVKISDDVLKATQDQAKAAGKALEQYMKGQLQRSSATAKVLIKDFKEQQKEFEIGVDFLQVGLNAVGDIYDAQSKRRIEQLQAQQDLIETNLQKEIDGINKSGLAEEEKARKIAQIEGEAAAQKQALADEERKQKIKQAQTDKAIAIMNIILNTAAAVVKALPSIPLSILAGVTGAAQLAVAVATPIPQYMHGTEYHPGGFAIEGDGNEQELNIEPSGKMYWSPDTATLMKPAKGTKVIPEHVLMQQILNGQSTLNSGSMATSKESLFLSEIAKGNRRIENAIKNKKEFNINVTSSGWQFQSKQANARTTYINNNIQFGG